MGNELIGAVATGTLKTPRMGVEVEGQLMQFCQAIEEQIEDRIQSLRDAKGGGGGRRRDRRRALFLRENDLSQNSVNWLAGTVMWSHLFCVVSVFVSFSSGASCLSEYLPGSFRKIVTHGDYLLGIDQFGVVRQVEDIGVIGKYLDTPVCRVRNVISVAGGVENIAVLINTDAGKQEIRAWGRNALKAFSGDMNDWRPIEPPVPSSMISRRGYEGMLLAKDGDVYSWMYYADIKKIQGLPKMAQVVSGILFNVGIDRSGRVWEWAGFLGNDDIYPRKELINTGPKPVMVDVRAIEVSVGLGHYLVLGDTGAVYARIYGETPESNLLVRVEGLSGIKKLRPGITSGWL